MEELGRFYGESYFGGQSDFHRGENYFEERRKHIGPGTLTGVALLADLGVRNKRIVEIGAADGALLAWCKEHGAASVTGVEFSEEAAAWGRANYGINIIHSDLDPNAIPERSVDLVVAVDLIEHLQNPGTLIATSSKWLAPNGRLAMICPNGRALDFWGSWWIGAQEHMEHLSYLTRAQFMKWAHEFGFVVEKYIYSGCPLRTAQYRNGGDRLSRLLREPHKAAYNSLLAAATAVMPSSALHEQSIVLKRT
jgi:2-polyprenyl-3-methyl-5-hydroxy-6-metoxy-1,4-benzoquinol methylase